MRIIYFYTKRFLSIFIRRKLFTLLLVLFILALFYYDLNHDITIQVIKSQCECRKDVIIRNHSQNIVSVDSRYLLKYQGFILNKYEDHNAAFDTVHYLKNYKYTCGLYNSLKRGPNQRVLSYTMYGETHNYYNELSTIAQLVRTLYPNWIIRVYHNSKLNKSVICEFECKEDIIDFCNVDEMPFSMTDDDKKQKIFYYNTSYVHAMMWRWYPIADDFVDYFSSRDLDSQPIQREKDSVDVWLYKKTSTLFHIMRDSPFHNTAILGGMWGFANIRNRQIGKSVYEIIMSRRIQKDFNPLNLNPKLVDQGFLTAYVWPIAEFNSTIHDSYLCSVLGGEPFPTRRPEDKYCHVACFIPCCDSSLNQVQTMPLCPIQCRPKEHQNWYHC